MRFLQNPIKQGMHHFFDDLAILRVILIALFKRSMFNDEVVQVYSFCPYGIFFLLHLRTLDRWDVYSVKIWRAQASKPFMAF